MQHFTISYAGASHAWAAWMGDQLALQGHTFTMHRWNPPADAPLAEAYEQLTTAGDQTVLLLDDWYFTTGGHSAQERSQALHTAVLPQQDTVTVVDVASRELPPAAAALRPVGLLNLGETEARRRLFTALGLDTDAVETLTESGATPAHRFPNTPPAVFRAPRRNSRFTGREKHLEALHDRFTSAGSGPVLIALHGLQGVGKTQIADEYVHRFGNEYDIVWYINADIRAQARQQFAELAGRLGQPSGSQLGEQIRAAHEALRTGAPHRRWLMVLDGTEFPEDVAELIPDGDGHVLVTTRSLQWSGFGAELVGVEPFDRAESVAFVQRRAERLTAQEASELAVEMEDFPLLLDQTAAWLAHNATMPLTEYLRLVRQGDVNTEPGAGYPHNFDQAWAATFNTLYDEDPLSYELLSLLAFFAPDTIPVRLLRTARRDDLPEPLSGLLADASRWHGTLRKLREVAALRIEYADHMERGDVPAVHNVRMHRLYQAVVKWNMGADAHDRAAATACRVLAAADPRDPADRANWSRYDELVPHLESSGALVSDVPEVHTFVLNCIEYLRVRGEYVSGWSLCRDFLTHLRGRLPATDGRLLEAEHQHANMLRRMGRYAAAMESGRQVLHWLEADPQAEPLARMRAQDGLAGSLLGLGRYEEARDLFTREAEAAEAELDATVPRALSARSNLGVAQTLLGEYETALTTHRKVLEERRRSLGEQHPQTLYSTLRYAWVLRLLGRYDKAVSVQSLNARVHAQVLGKHHEQTLHAEHNLALCLRRTGDVEYSQTLMRSVTERTRRKLGAHHPETLIVASDYGMLLRQHGDQDEARELAESVAEDYRSQLGAEHPYTIGTFGNIALTSRAGSGAPEALSVAEETLQRMTNAVGGSHPWTLGCALNVVTARHLTGEDDGAVRLAQGLLPRVERTLGTGHPLEVCFRSALVHSLYAVGDRQAAEKELRWLLRHTPDTSGEEEHRLTDNALPYWDFEPQPI